MEPRIGAIGHSHVALCFTRQDGELIGEQAPGGTEHDLADGEWLLNPGSVGQPRDGDPRAAWLLVDLDAGRPVAASRVPDRRGSQGDRGRRPTRRLADRLFVGQ